MKDIDMNQIPGIRGRYPFGDASDLVSSGLSQ